MKLAAVMIKLHTFDVDSGHINAQFFYRLLCFGHGSNLYCAVFYSTFQFQTTLFFIRCVSVRMIFQHLSSGCTFNQTLTND